MMLRIDHDPRLRRSEMHRIAGINARTGAVNITDGHTLTEDERARIDAWLAQGNGLPGDAATAVARIGHIAHWAQFTASPDTLDAATEELLLAMQDLREVLVRKAAQRATRG